MDPSLGSALDVVTATCLLDKAAIQPAAAEPAVPTLLTASEVCKLVKIGKRTFWRLVKKGILPRAHVVLGARLLRWSRAEVLQHLIDYSTGRRRPPQDAA